MLGFGERGKLEYPEKKSEPTTNSNHIWHQQWVLNLDYIGGRQVLSTLDHPCPPNMPPLPISPPFWEKKLINPSSLLLPFYSSWQNDRLYWLNTTVTQHVDWSSMAYSCAGSTDFILFFNLWLPDLPTSCTWSFALSILVVYEDLIPSSWLN